jgi:hypothetical protein
LPFEALGDAVGASLGVHGLPAMTGPAHEPASVTPRNAPFETYKAPRIPLFDKQHRNSNLDEAGRRQSEGFCGLRGAGTHVVDPAGDEQVARGIDIAAVLVAICWGPAFNIS